MTDELVQFRTEGPVAILTLNRPDRRNAVNLAMADAISAALDTFETRDDLRVGILTGAGPVFCAGLDLAAPTDEQDKTVFHPDGFAGIVKRRLSKPLIGAANGPALAGGFEVLLACDFIYAAPTAQFGLPEPLRGLFAAGGGVLRLGGRIPPARAAEMLLTGLPIAADEAQALGLVNRVVPSGELLDAAIATASTIANNAPNAISQTLALARAAEESGYAALWEDSDQRFRTVLPSDEAKEGMLAFTEKRAPKWQTGDA
jgi:enoyl-CoA hydratase